MRTITNYILALLLTSLCVASAFADENILNIYRGDATTVGIYVKDLRSGEVLASHNASRAMTPASVTKLITSAAVMLQCGIDSCFTTNVRLSGHPAGQGQWRGDLIVEACADPTIEHSEFAEYMGFCDSIVAHIQQMGLTKIDGHIRIDEHLPEAGAIVNWECDDIPWPYGAGLYGFNYGENYVKVFPNKGVTEPASTLEINVVTSRSTTDLRRGFGSNRLTVVMPRRKRRQANFSINSTLNDPAAMFAMLLKAKLAQAHIEVSDDDSRDTSSGASRTVYTHHSPSFGEILYVTNKISDNLLAEGMLRTLAPDSCRQVCLQTELKMLDSLRIDTDCLQLLDGSGLARADLMQPATVGQLLEAMLYTEYADLFIDMLPVAGIDGTLKSFACDTPLQGRAAMKTGSMRNVQNMAGYLLDDEGMPTHVVVVFVNGFFCKRADLRTAIADYLTQFLQNQ